MASSSVKEIDRTNSFVDHHMSFVCEHNHRFYFFLNHSRWLCQIRVWNSSFGVWELVDVITDCNDDTDGIVSERINRVCR